MTATQKPKLNRQSILRRAMAMMRGDRDEGICLACGATAHGVEPDARQYVCEACGQPKVYGGEEIVMMLGF